MASAEELKRMLLSILDSIEDLSALDNCMKDLSIPDKGMALSVALAMLQDRRGMLTGKAGE